MRKLLAKAESHGCTVKRTGGGHWKIIAPSGAVVITGFSPSSPRSIHQTINRLRHAGVPI